MLLLCNLLPVIFILLLHGASAVDTESVSVLEGDSVTLNTGVQTNQQEEIKWYYNDILIAEITGDQSQICTDDQCKERFRDRLKLDHQTGSLTITHTTNTHSGEYKLQININNSFSITTVKRFNLTVIAVPGSGLSSEAAAGIVVAGVVFAVLLVYSAAAGVIYYRRRQRHIAVPLNQVMEVHQSAVILLLVVCVSFSTHADPQPPPDVEPRYLKFLKQHFGPDMSEQKCDRKMNNGITGPNGVCKDVNTFIQANSNEIKAVCGTGGRPQGGDLFKSGQQFPVITCKLKRGSRPPRCAYRGKRSTRYVVLGCEKGWPVHYDEGTIN
ncbi:ribonuclease like [Pimephales promelas]|nr:ribonuclease like [Pimephales promelas]